VERCGEESEGEEREELPSKALVKMLTEQSALSKSTHREIRG